MKAVDVGFSIGIVLLGIMICIEFVRGIVHNYCIRKELKYQKEIGRYFDIVKERDAIMKELQKHMLQMKQNLERIEKQVVLDETDKKIGYMSGFWRQNKVLLTLLDDYRCMAEQMHIKYVVQVDNSAVFPCNELDTVSLFGNLLDNAIEACVACKASEAVPHICVTLEAFLRGQQIATRFVLENSKTSVYNPLEHDFVTTKSNIKEHGRGVAIIKELVKKYGGKVFWEDKGGQFVTRVEFWEEEEHV